MPTSKSADLSSRLRAVNLRVDAMTAPIGLGSSRPEFSWHLSDARTGITQGAYQLEVLVDTTGAVVWDSGRTEHDLPFGISYAGADLTSATAYRWRVRLWDGDGRTGGWSTSTVFETGILNRSEWSAEWITAPSGVVGAHSPVYLRGDLSLDRPLQRATAYASGLGWYRLFVNGLDMTGPALVPRYTPFSEEVEYQAYDITSAISEGTNVVAMALGDGRFRGHIGFFDRREVYGSRLAGFVQIVLDFADGTRSTWTSDGSWSAGQGRITASDPKLGEHADLRIPDAEWLTGTRPPARFAPVEIIDPPSRRLVAEQVPRVTAIERFTPRTWRSPSGRQLVDLGQNIAGVLRIRLRGTQGDRVRMTFGEALTPDGEFDPDWIIQNPKKRWYQRDEVILSGDEQWWEPWFTIHGFRYVEIDGLGGDLSPDDVEGIALSSQLDAAGTFAASDPRLTRLWQNVHWSTRSNFTDVPTDCPTRERSGWTGDIQVFAPTATGIVDAQAFLRRYLRSVALEQRENGNVSPWVPSERSGRAGWVADRIGDMLGNSTGWGDVTVLTPWTLYRYYGDQTVLRQQYRSMQLWVRRLGRAARRRGAQRWFAKRAGAHERYIVDSGFHWGEWLRPGESFPANFFDGRLHGAVIATAYFEHSSRTLARTASVLGRTSDARRYEQLADRVRTAWRAVFIEDEGSRVGRDLQDDYVRALAFDLLDGDERSRAAARLVELIDAAEGHLATGFLSTPMLLAVLADTGHTETLFRILMQTTSPSWLHQVERGATTIWETWEGHDERGHAEASQNHYALGSVAGWLREGLAGIHPLSPGYRRIGFHPLPGGGLDWVTATVATPFGPAESAWRIDGDEGELTVTVPVGTEAEITPPDGSRHIRGSGTWRFTWTTAIEPKELR